MKRVLAVAASWLACAPFVAWAAGALYFDLPAPAIVRSGAALVWAVGALAALALVRPLRRGWLAVALGFAAIVAWWFTIEPRQDRDWRPEVAVAPHATIAGDRVTLHGVRDFEYRTEDDFTPRYLERPVHLANLRGLDFFQCYWGSPLMAHPIVSFDFGDEGRVCFSIETRKERGEGYSTLGGIYRQFELLYVVAEERDIVRLRTNLRQGEDVYLYRLQAPVEAVRELFLGYVRRIDELHEAPEFYNAITANCTTSIRLQRSPEERVPFDYRVLLNGLLDEFLYEQGRLDRSLPFAELKERAHINARARAAGDAADFSARIRAPDAAPAASPRAER